MELIHKLNHQWIFTDRFSFALLIEDEGDAYFLRVFHTSSDKTDIDKLMNAFQCNAYLISKACQKELNVRFRDDVLIHQSFFTTL